MRACSKTGAGGTVRHGTAHSDPAPGLPIGRAALLGTFAAGIGGIAVAPALSRLLSSAVPSAPGGLGDVLPGIGGGWRIYSVQYPLPASIRRPSS